MLEFFFKGVITNPTRGKNEVKYRRGVQGTTPAVTTACSKGLAGQTSHELTR